MSSMVFRMVLDYRPSRSVVEVDVRNNISGFVPDFKFPIQLTEFCRSSFGGLADLNLYFADLDIEDVHKASSHIEHTAGQERVTGVGVGQEIGRPAAFR